MDSQSTENRKVFLLGGMHIINIPPSLLAAHKIDVIFSEGINYTKVSFLRNFSKEPFFMMGWYIYIIFLRIAAFFGRGDLNSLYKYADQNNIHVECVDVSMNDLVDKFHNLFNPFIEMVFFLVSYGMFTVSIKTFDFLNWVPNYLIILIAGLFSCFIYLTFWVWRTANYRNEEMTKNIVKFLDNKNYHNILFYSGSLHTKEMEQLFEKRGFDIETLPSLKII